MEDQSKIKIQLDLKKKSNKKIETSAPKIQERETIQINIRIPNLRIS